MVEIFAIFSLLPLPLLAEVNGCLVLTGACVGGRVNLLGNVNQIARNIVLRHFVDVVVHNLPAVISPDVEEVQVGLARCDLRVKLAHFADVHLDARVAMQLAPDAPDVMAASAD